MRMLEERAARERKRREAASDELTHDLLTCVSRLLDTDEVMDSPGLAQIVRDNIGWLDEGHDVVKCACLVAGKVLKRHRKNP